MSEPFTVRFTTATDSERTLNTRSALSYVLTLGLIAGMVSAASSRLLPSSSASLVCSFAVTLPALVYQDTWRYLYYARGKPQAAALSSGGWTTLQLLGFTIIHFIDVPKPWILVGIWGASCGFAALTVNLIYRDSIRLAPARRWISTTGTLARPYLIEAVLFATAATLVFAVAIPLSGFSAAAIYRAAQLLTSPVTVVFAGLNAVALPNLRRLAETNPAALFPAAKALREPKRH